MLIILAMLGAMAWESDQGFAWQGRQAADYLAMARDLTTNRGINTRREVW